MPTISLVGILIQFTIGLDLNKQKNDDYLKVIEAKSNEYEVPILLSICSILFVQNIC